MLRASVLAFALFATVSAQAQREVLVVSSAFADPSIIAPVVRLEVDRGDGISYAAGISGWTIDGEWAKRLSASSSLRLTADATPINAHNSNLMYVNGVRSEQLDFRDASYRLRGGLRFRPGARQTVDVMGVALYEIVGDLPTNVEARWERPYAGVEVSHTLSVVKARELLVSAFDGLEITSRAELFAGKRNWSRLSVVEQAGRSLGRFHLRQSVAILDGSSLDAVNQHVAGGSWDALGGTAIYGLRYGQVRTGRALILNGGADMRVGGNWRAGLRGSYADTAEGRTHGYAINASTTWKTNGFNFGVGVDEESNVTAYAALIVPLYRRK